MPTSTSISNCYCGGKVTWTDTKCSGCNQIIKTERKCDTCDKDRVDDTPHACMCRK